jgi:hypothetical protein
LKKEKGLAATIRPNWPSAGAERIAGRPSKGPRRRDYHPHPAILQKNPQHLRLLRDTAPHYCTRDIHCTNHPELSCLRNEPVPDIPAHAGAVSGRHCMAMPTCRTKHRSDGQADEHRGAKPKPERWLNGIRCPLVPCPRQPTIRHGGAPVPI